MDNLCRKLFHKGKWISGGAAREARIKRAGGIENLLKNNLGISKPESAQVFNSHSFPCTIGHSSRRNLTTTLQKAA